MSSATCRSTARPTAPASLAKEHAGLTRATTAERLEDVLVAVLGDEALLHNDLRLSSFRPKQKMRRRAYNGSMVEFLAKLDALLVVRDQLGRWPFRSDSHPELKRLAHFKMHLPRHKHPDIHAAIQERDEELWAWVCGRREQRAV
ncbi:hypothetical protein [Agrococcus sp. DT81.2]|uniref:hypothetical protein n=1 Tax=Agrococcus sp. DT81.2 TaxID=3393414 RepID=UPI003CE49EC8